MALLAVAFSQGSAILCERAFLVAVLWVTVIGLVG